ncbi:hypothetical protein TSAR_011838 [Trichomalopsis sarcophagae]|uniref:Large ribosomal subunit protein mL42 n=1 Tax=Trichomalopsis sarcophagae TaxID=543379 RepID=A0A232ET28_9HYME|nr:hypothetical protein TSAR_011838 [Trichomalopsis sarcophagae]
MNIGLRLFRAVQKHSSQVRAYSQLPPELVVFMNNEMVVCWHPEQTFPYECSKPLPVREPEPESVLKIGEVEVKAMFKHPKADLIPEELGRITYTCKHRWFPKARSKKYKNTEPDRPYL